MEVLLEEKVRPYRVEVPEDEERARATAAEFEASVYTPAMVRESTPSTSTSTTAVLRPWVKEDWTLREVPSL